MTIERNRKELRISLFWMLVVLSLAVVLFVVAPGRGAAWVDDDGFFLRMSWQAASGSGLDKQIPQAPSYLVNAGLMALGVHNVLSFRYSNYIVIFLSSTIFFLSFDKRRWNSPMVPLAVCLSLLVSLDAIQNPNSLSLAFFLAGAGLYCFSCDTTGWKHSLLLTGSGLLLAVCGFMHAAVALAMILIVIIAIIIDPSLRRKALWPAFLMGSVLLWGVYLTNLGLQNFLTNPSGHDGSFRYLLFRVAIISWFYVEAIAAYLIAVAFLRRERRKLAHTILVAAVTLFYVLSLVAYAFNFSPPMQFPLHGLFLLSREGQWISRIPGALAYYILLFTGMRWLVESWSDAVWASSTSLINRVQFAITESFNTMRAGVSAHKWTIAIFGCVLLQAATGVGSNTSVSQGMVFLAGPVLGLGIMMWSSMRDDPKPKNLFFPTVVAVLIGSCALFTLAYNHPTQQPILARNRVVLRGSVLDGIYESPRYNRSTAELFAAYQQNNCKDKVFVVLTYAPLLYYMFQHPVPEKVGILRPVMYYSEDDIRSVLNSRNGWCVVDATDNEIAHDIAVRGWDKREPLRRWLQDNSARKIAISSVNPAYLSDIELYAQ